MPGPQKDIAKHKMWLSLIERFKTSGLSQGKFCEQEKVPVKRFVYWYRRYRDGKLGVQREPAKSKHQPKEVLVPVRVMPPTRASRRWHVRDPGCQSCRRCRPRKLAPRIRLLAEVVMLSFPATLQIFFCVVPIDMRCSFDRLQDCTQLAETGATMRTPICFPQQGGGLYEGFVLRLNVDAIEDAQCAFVEIYFDNCGRQ